MVRLKEEITRGVGRAGVSMTETGNVMRTRTATRAAHAQGYQESLSRQSAFGVLHAVIQGLCRCLSSWSDALTKSDPHFEEEENRGKYHLDAGCGPCGRPPPHYILFRLAAE